MLSQFINWRTMLAMIAIIIVSGTIFYSNYLSKKIAANEREKVNVWVQSLKTRAVVNEQAAIDLTNTIASHNTDIPIVETDENDIPSGQGLNLDTLLLKDKGNNYLNSLIEEFKNLHEPITVEINKNPLIVNKYYYGKSKLLKEVSYYPYVQLLIVALFVVIMLIGITTHNKSTQNQVWAGMAKETAHQLGTPVSSLEGWVEHLKENKANEKIVVEINKDISRLKLVSDRFGKIGSTPQLEQSNIIAQIENMVNYIKRRASGKVNFSISSNTKMVMANINPLLFDWVIENLLKNALDAMEGQGSIAVSIYDEPKKIVIDITDTGKGINKQHIAKVFKPGFTTKKRGWGLGLSLAKRIMKQYHKGELFVKQSEVGKGTTFRIVLMK